MSNGSFCCDSWSLSLVDSVKVWNLFFTLRSMVTWWHLLEFVGADCLGNIHEYSNLLANIVQLPANLFWFVGQKNIGTSHNSNRTSLDLIIAHGKTATCKAKAEKPQVIEIQSRSKGSLGGGFKYFLCSSLFGEMIQFDEHMFQMGWNHQLDHCCW